MLKTLCCVLILCWAWSASAESVWDKDVTTEKQTIEVIVQHDPNCGCCTAWVKHLEQHNIKVISIKNEQMAAYKAKMNIPAQMQSCHTATVGSYVIEGHVPANDIKDLVASQDRTIYGLSVPAMPVGTPGMEMGVRKDSFAVMSFDKSGHSQVHKEYRQY